MRQPRNPHHFHFYMMWMAGHYHKADTSDLFMNAEDTLAAIEADPPWHVPDHWYWSTPRGQSLRDRLTVINPQTGMKEFPQEIPFTRSQPQER